MAPRKTQWKDNIKINPKRPTVNTEDINKALQYLQTFATEIREQAGSGAFVHPHEIVGCMTGQLLKLSSEADKTHYSGDVEEFRKRCLKAAFPLIFGIASIDVMVREANAKT